MMALTAGSENKTGQDTLSFQAGRKFLSNLAGT